MQDDSKIKLEQFPDVMREDWSAEKISEEAANEQPDDTLRQMLRGDETIGNLDESDVAGGVESEKGGSVRVHGLKGNPRKARRNFPARMGAILVRGLCKSDRSDQGDPRLDRQPPQCFLQLRLQSVGLRPGGRRIDQHGNAGFSFDVHGGSRHRVQPQPRADRVDQRRCYLLSGQPSQLRLVDLADVGHRHVVDDGHGFRPRRRFVDAG